MRRGASLPGYMPPYVPFVVGIPSSLGVYMPPWVCIPGHMPPCVYTRPYASLCTMPGIPPCVYASLVYTSRCTRLPASRVQPSTSTCYTVRHHGFYTFNTGVRERRPPWLGSTLLPSLRKSLPPRGNLSLKAEKPATESTPAQGCQEYLNPSKGVVKPP